MLYLKDPTDGFEQTSDAQLFHDRSREAACEIRKFIVSISVGAIGFLYLEMGINTGTGQNTSAATIATLAAFFLASGASILAWYFDARRFYFRGKSIDAQKLEVQEQLYGKYQALTTWARRLTFISRLTFLLGIMGLFVLGVIRA